MVPINNLKEAFPKSVLFNLSYATTKISEPKANLLVANGGTEIMSSSMSWSTKPVGFFEPELTEKIKTIIF